MQKQRFRNKPVCRQTGSNDRKQNFPEWEVKINNFKDINKMRKLTLIFAVLLYVANILTAQETKGKPTIVVIPFDAKNIEQSDAEVLLETFTNKIADSGKFKVVDRSKVNEIKKQHEFQNSDWSNDEKVAKLGNALNANMVVVGKLMPFQKKINASFRILDVNTMEIVSTADGVFDDILAFFNKIPEIVKKLTGEIKSISTTSNITTSKTRSTSSTSKTTTTYGKTYNIGDTGPGGGIIFYYSKAGFDVYEPDGSTKKCHYLEVSKFDLGKISWCSQKAEFEYSADRHFLLRLLCPGKAGTSAGL
jgi:TolB-like protein